MVNMVGIHMTRMVGTESTDLFGGDLDFSYPIHYRVEGLGELARRRCSYTGKQGDEYLQWRGYCGVSTTRR